MAVCNHDEGILASIKALLETEGFSVVTLHIQDIRNGKVEFVSWVKRNNPNVVIYDISYPYQNELNFFSLVQDSGAMQGRCVILTTTNVNALHQTKGDVVAHEVIDKPFSIEALIKAVKETCAQVTKAA